MKFLQVYDPPMCCATGVCGPKVDIDLVNFAALLVRLGKLGVRVERYQLAQQPMEFARNATIREMLEKDGNDALPVIFADGALLLHGRYPTSEERQSWEQQAKETMA